MTKTLVKRAEKSGYKGIFVTVDTPVLGQRYRDAKNGFTLPSHLRLLIILLNVNDYLGMLFMIVD